jgi:predicted DNA-binding protein (UPF0251 family)
MSCGLSKREVHKTRRLLCFGSPWEESLCDSVEWRYWRFGATAQRLIRLIEEGRVDSQSDAARQLGVSRQRVSQIMKRTGVNVVPVIEEGSP